MSAGHLSALMKAIVVSGWRFTTSLDQLGLLQMLAYAQNETRFDLAWPAKRTLAEWALAGRPEFGSIKHPGRNVQRILAELADDLRIIRRFDVGPDAHLYEIFKGTDREQVRWRTETVVPGSFHWNVGGTHRFLTPIRSRPLRDDSGKVRYEYFVELPRDSFVSPPSMDTVSRVVSRVTSTVTHEVPGDGSVLSPEKDGAPPGDRTVSPLEISSSPKRSTERPIELDSERSYQKSCRASAAPLTPALAISQDGGDAETERARLQGLERLHEISKRLATEPSILPRRRRVSRRPA